MRRKKWPSCDHSLTSTPSCAVASVKRCSRPLAMRIINVGLPLKRAITIVGIDDPRSGPREAHEDEAGHDRHEGHAGKDFGRGDDMTVERRRRHHAIADGRQSFEA